MRRIRNDFAHKPHGITFKTPMVHDKIRNLKICKLKDGKKGKILPLDLNNPRKAFTDLGTFLYGYLDNLEEKIVPLSEHNPFIEELLEKTTFLT